jgi:ribosomal protein S18 acetylase RimI-like enzyme
VTRGTLEIQPVTPDRWDDVVELFERRGPRGGHRNTPAYGCWCMYWRDRSLEHGTPKKRALGRLVRRGDGPGLLAYDGGDVVGWVSVAPRETYPVLLRSPQYRPVGDEEGVWSIVCFVVDREARGRGVATALLHGAVEHARARGARYLEAYPHATTGDDYMGSVRLFRSAGFRKQREANKRVIVRRELA